MTAALTEPVIRPWTFDALPPEASGVLGDGPLEADINRAAWMCSLAVRRLPAADAEDVLSLYDRLLVVAYGEGWHETPEAQALLARAAAR